MLLTIHEELMKLVPTFKAGVISYSNINVQHSSSEIQMQLKEIYSILQSQQLTEIPGIKEARQLFKAIGIDPSKYRPSSEALIRRVLKGDQVPSIHSAADVNNLFSLKYGLPIGIYGLDKLSGPIELRVGNENDRYEAINNRQTNMRGKLLSSDTIGPFGSPIVDSKRTMVTLATKQAVQIIYFHLELNENEMKAIMNDVCEYFVMQHGGEANPRIVG
ncbi:hypothetical protein H1D32_04095 [Anaerobacillus sp. CMMVII]|uniref:B3/B4 domain-containing protein n=1 Tax=Anaerobacillus sp. CMMVII TaxID=2755588 RepID=UPI0021B796B2|nr:phenylalanine--tRNA ligase beta subunit-related protein [Anaerobacillus sp. CMMVII]MCT8136991.1 hypothetical protein [Anaerobacillus sp. CMMVII]